MLCASLGLKVSSTNLSNFGLLPACMMCNCALWAFACVAVFESAAQGTNFFQCKVWLWSPQLGLTYHNAAVIHILMLGILAKSFMTEHKRKITQNHTNAGGPSETCPTTHMYILYNNHINAAPYPFWLKYF
jgi:hypothetical protein